MIFYNICINYHPLSLSSILKPAIGRTHILCSGICVIVYIIYIAFNKHGHEILMHCLSKIFISSIWNMIVRYHLICALIIHLKPIQQQSPPPLLVVMDGIVEIVVLDNKRDIWWWWEMVENKNHNAGWYIDGNNERLLMVLSGWKSLAWSWKSSMMI